MKMTPMLNDQGKKKRNVISYIENSMWTDVEPMSWPEMPSCDLESIICDW